MEIFHLFFSFLHKKLFCLVIRQAPQTFCEYIFCFTNFFASVKSLLVSSSLYLIIKTTVKYKCLASELTLTILSNSTVSHSVKVGILKPICSSYIFPITLSIGGSKLFWIGKHSRYKRLMRKGQRGWFSIYLFQLPTFCPVWPQYFSRSLSLYVNNNSIEGVGSNLTPN